ncbi:hypothetical protein AWB67_06442 [Caballeronia terrestris]|uniref:Uncharacterized protein n=1 Tax=Caballeronia terrestris TaxID=1226301 RepID=A0A158KQZ5_9BURK|nr:hypothetical protein [Caballeronia terrestris]SAL83568.1 hypothetical protein AWB67_06442 [Caballeronia terrestris]
MKALYPETLDQLADRWTVLMNQLNRHEGRYHGQSYVDVAELVQQTEHIIKPDPFEQEVLQTVCRLTADGNLKMALFRLHEVIEARLERRGA